MIGPRQRARLWLACGAAIGLGLAAHGMLRGPTSPVPPGVVAMVGDVPITTEEYARALAAVASDRRNAPDRALQRHVLDRLIDEELLVQAALQSGLAVRDPALRGQIASAMIDAVLGPRAAPTEEELRAHYTANTSLFARNGRVRVEALWFDKGDTRARAAAARARLLAGQPVTDADPPALVAPTASIPQVKLTDYLGPVVAQAVATTPVGGVTEAIEASGGRWVVRVLERKDGEVPAFEVVREQVLADLRRARDDEALRRWLDRRRLDTRVAVREPLP
ncbi:MAG: peptidyl-prolyl cis-trans isomerase [Deltaproteobacteria bacterium]|nr:peptidyl-prolyl cis-trans isomerase [Deltaproteobacteria bacterium]